MLRTLLTGERTLIQFFPWLSWEITFRIEMLSIYIGTPIFFMFLKSLFPSEINDNILSAIKILGLIGVTTLFLPTTLFHFPYIVFLFIIFICGIYGTYILISAVLKK